MASQTVYESSLLLLTRLSLLTFCRTYLLRNLVQDLRHLSVGAGSSGGVPNSLSMAHDEDSSMDETEAGLPPPITTPGPTTSSFSQNLHSATKRPLSSASRTSSIQDPGSPNAPQGSRGRLGIRSWAESHMNHSSISRLMFSLCFSESCTLFLLVGFQTIGLLSDRTRLLNWNISLIMILSSILIIIPLLQCLLITSRSSLFGHFQRRSFLAIIPYGVYLYVLSLIPTPTTSDSPLTKSLSFNFLNRLIVLGVLILGVLSGFGAVRNIWALSRVWSSSTRLGRHPASVSNIEVARAEQSLDQIRSDLDTARRQLALPRPITSSKATQSTGWLTRFLPGASDEHVALRQQIQGLEALERDMSRGLRSMNTKLAEAAYSRTWLGRMWGIISPALGVYCIYRACSSIFNLIAPGQLGRYAKNPKALASDAALSDIFIQYILRTFPRLDITPERAISLSRQFSLLMVGLIVLSSVRLVLRGVTRALRITSKGLGTSFLLLFLAQLMGIYLLSTLIQLRSLFPAPVASPTLGHSSPTISLFSTLPPFEFFGPLFDVSFLVSVGIFALARSIMARVYSDEETGWGMVERT